MDGIERARAGREGLRQLARCVCGAALALSVFAVIALWETVAEYRNLGDLSLYDIHRHVVTLDGFVLAGIAITGALFVAWMFRARAAAATLRDEPETVGDAWVTLGWLPLVNLVVPFMFAAELYRDADPDVMHHDARASGRPWIVAAWTIPTVIVAIIADLRLRFAAAEPIRFFAARLPQYDVSSAKGSVIVDIIALAALALSAALVSVVVQKISQRLWQCCDVPARANEQQPLVSAS